MFAGELQEVGSAIAPHLKVALATDSVSFPSSYTASSEHSLHKCCCSSGPLPTAW
jgi:hypothetical protein